MRRLVLLLLALGVLRLGSAAEPAPEPEVVLARRLIARANLEAARADLWRRFAESEATTDRFRLSRVSALRRDPLELPGATKAFARGVAGAKGDLAAILAAAGPWVDAAVVASPLAAPPPGSKLEAHLDHCLERMRRADALVKRAFRDLAAEEVAFLGSNLFTFARKFRQHIYIDNDKDAARAARHVRVVGLLAKVDRASLVGALGELAPLASKGYLDQLRKDLAGASPLERASDLGPVVVAGARKDVHRGRHALRIDLGGDDVHEGPTAFADDELRVAVSIDLAGNDVYDAKATPFAQGAAVLGVALLVDRSGDDRYASDTLFAQGAACAGAAALVDLAGNDVMSGETYAQGSALAQGAAVLVDVEGNDRHEAGLYAQGFAGAGALGLLVDQGGDDRHFASNLRPCSYGEKGYWDGFSQGCATGFRRFGSGGVAALVDAGGKDTYEAGNFSQGGGYYYGWGLLADLGKESDRYDGSRYAQGFAAHQALGSLWDEAGDDHYSCRVIAAQSIAWDLSATSLTDSAGNDRYEGGGGTSIGASAHNGFALFYDAGGADSYKVGSSPPARAGPNDYHGGGSLSVFLDVAGPANTYIDVAPTASFTPGRGVFVTPEASIVADFPWKMGEITEKRLAELFKSRR